MGLLKPSGSPAYVALSLWGPVVVSMAAIFYLSSLPDLVLPPGPSDKSWHSSGYFCLGVLVMRAVASGLPARVTLRRAAIAVAITVVYGASDELHQSYVPGRYADVADVYADAIGAVAAAGACWAWGIISVRSDV